MCLVLEYWNGFVVVFTALSLSHRRDTSLNLIPKSNSAALIHNKCVQLLPVEMIKFCFFEVQDTCDLPSIWYVSEMLFLCTLQLT